MLRRTSRVSAKNQLRWLARCSNEPNLTMPGFAGQNLKMPRQQLEHFIDRAVEANRLRRRRLIERRAVCVHCMRCVRRVLEVHRAFGRYSVLGMQPDLSTLWVGRECDVVQTRP